MKTRRQKVLAILAACLLCASFFALPVSAADSPYYVNFDFPVIGDTGLSATPDLNFLRVFASGNNPDYFSVADSSSYSDAPMAESGSYIGPPTSPEGVNYQFDFVSYNAGVASFWIGQSTFGVSSYSSNDTVWINPGSFHIQINTEYSAFTKYRFCLRPISKDYKVGKVIASTDISDFYISNTGGGPSHVVVNYPRSQFTFTSGASDVAGLLLCLEFYGSAMSGADITLGAWNTTVGINYGSGSSPNYPMYGGADSGNTGALEDTESQLQDSAAGGLEESEELFTNFDGNFLDFGFVFLYISRLLSRITGGIPYMDALIQISLSLGLFASLLALGASLVSAADRKAGREAAAAARSAQNERLARAIERSGKR